MLRQVFNLSVSCGLISDALWNGMSGKKKRIQKSSTNPRDKQRCALVFSFGHSGSNRTDRRKGPAQDSTEFCRVAGKERRRQDARTQRLRSMRDRNMAKVNTVYVFNNIQEVVTLLRYRRPCPPGLLRSLLTT